MEKTDLEFLTATGFICDSAILLLLRSGIWWSGNTLLWYTLCVNALFSF